MKMTQGVTAMAVHLLPNQRLDIFEAFAILPVPAFPANVPALFVVAWCQISALDQGKLHRLRTVLLDPDGHTVYEKQNEWDIPAIGAEWNFQPVLPFFTCTTALSLPCAGGYRFEIFDGEVRLGDVAFDVLLGE